MLGNAGSYERSGEIYLPYVGHVADDVVLLRDGSVLAMGSVAGVPFEMEEPALRNSRLRNLNTLFRNIADDNVTIATHLVRYPETAELPLASFRSSFVGALDWAYRARILRGRLFRNAYFITLLISPRNVLGKAGGQVARFGKRTMPAGGSDSDRRTLEDLWQVVVSSLAEYGVRRLGLRRQGEIVFSEIAEALRLIMTAEWFPVPLVSGSLGASIYTDRVICGKRGVEIRAPGKSKVGALYGFREYPAKTRPGMLNTLLSVDFPIVLSQSFAFLTRAQAHAKLELKSNQMTSAKDKAVSQVEGLAEAEDALASNAFVMGSHHLSLAVYADDLAQLADRAARARARLTDAGAVVVQEGIGMEAAYWSQLPGNSAWRTRPGAITSRNFAGFSGLDNYPMGSRMGHWGPALTQFRTVGGTAYDYVTHVADVGMTVIFGPIGSGKTTLLMFLLGMLEQYMVARDGAVVFFDKDRGGELLVRATGGTYLVLRRGEPSGLAPLRGLDNTPAARDFLREWVTGLIEGDGKGGITAEEARRLERGIGRQLSYPRHMRSLAGLREFLMHGPADGAGARLERWCRGAALGWAFDGDVDEVDLGAGINGFDMTHLLDYEEVCAPAAAYLLHRVGSVVDGRRFVMSCDEFRAYLLNPQFASVVDKFLLTVRKNNGMLILATQQPEHVLESKLGASLVAQCMTKILYPSPTADRAAYVDGLKCTEGEFLAVREGMPARSFLLKRDAGSVICDFDLSAMPEFVAVLSGRANTVRFAERLRRELGDEPSAWLPAFMARYREAKD
jgi:type IV secretion system protein VirB4